MIVKNNMPVVGTLNYKVNGVPKKTKIGGGTQLNLPDLSHESQVLNFQDILAGKYTLIATEIVKKPVIKEKIEDVVIEKKEATKAEEESALKKAKKEAKTYALESKKIKKLNKKK